MIGVGSDVKASQLWSSFHGTRKYCDSGQEREAIKWSFSNMRPLNGGKDQPDKICTKIQDVILIRQWQPVTVYRSTHQERNYT